MQASDQNSAVKRKDKRMEVFNRKNSNSTGTLPILKSWMLISPKNSCTQNLSLQVSEIPIGSEQPIHTHKPEQVYFIINGEGLMTIDEEGREVFAGDAVYVPENARHGIKNIGNDVLEYITANSPVFSENYERTLWPANPE
jgi:mannose-6-phosphate isomerase-like protein (cupin superfamily)